MASKPGTQITVTGDHADEVAAWLRAVLDAPTVRQVTSITVRTGAGHSATDDAIGLAVRAQLDAISQAAEAEWAAEMERVAKAERQQRREWKGESS